VTDLAYLADEEAAYTRQFVARVVALPPGGVVLDRTYFYPAGGGQQADHGTLTQPEGGTQLVVDVSRSGASVIHRTRRAPGSDSGAPRVGDSIEGTLDWDRRYRHMRLHTGQHLLSALIFERAGIRTREATMSGSSGFVDLDRPLPPDLGSDRIELAANDLLAEGRRVSIRHLSRESWERNPSPRSGLVPLPRHVDPVRIIEIAGLDSCPCGGTHVKSTSEVGRLAVDPPVPIALGGIRVPFRLLDVSTPTHPG
jgi:misacylated tRNA(Ala) deacylase